MNVLGQAAARAEKLFEAGAYWHWYERHGLSKSDFNAALATVQGLIEGYRAASLAS